jgi:hypothetical protein
MTNRSKPDQWHGLIAPPPSPAAWETGQPWTTYEDSAGAPHAQEKEREMTKPEIVNVVELSAQELENSRNHDMYVAPTDSDPFVRCQKIVIAYHCFYTEYPREQAYRRARKFARAIAALGAGIPLDKSEMSEFAFEIYDALASWAPLEDAAVQLMRNLFETYALPLPDTTYRHVRVIKPRQPR